MTEEQSQIYVVGEALIDFFAPLGTSLAEAEQVNCLPGGAPTNVAIQLARLRAPCQLVTCVGQGPLGRRLLGILDAEGVGATYIRQVDKRTGLTLVSVAENGDRHFVGYRDDCADLQIDSGQVEKLPLKAGDVVHHGTVSLRAEPAKSATLSASARAKTAGALVTVDVNLRPGMYPDRETLIAVGLQAVTGADIIKATQEEALWLTGESDMNKAAAALIEKGPQWVCITADSEGATLFTARGSVAASAPETDVVDSTGAGDAFWGAFLSKLQDHKIAPESLASVGEELMAEVLAFACSAGAHACTALGATTGMMSR